MSMTMRYLEDYEPILSQILRLCAKRTDFTCEPPLSEVLAGEPRLIVVVNHSTPLSWLPAISLLVVNACARGGRRRTPMGVMDRFFFQVPLFREIAHLITQSQEPLSFRDILDKFENEKAMDLVIFPEGSNCFFGQPETIQAFRSPKFAEISIRTQTPILVVAHEGSENWAKPLEVPQPLIDHLNILPAFAKNFLERRLRETGKLILPLFPKPMDSFSMRCELYRPSLQPEDLSENQDERREQVSAEAEKVRSIMQNALSRLKVSRSGDTQ